MDLQKPKTVYLVEFHIGGHQVAYMQIYARSLLSLGHRVVCIMPDTKDVSLWLAKNCPEHQDRTHFFQVAFPNTLYNRNGKLSRLINYLYFWNYYRQQVNKIKKATGYAPDLVFFNDLDGLLNNHVPHHLVDLVFRFSWAGLCFQFKHLRPVTDHPNYYRIGLSSIDNILLSRHCIAVTTLDSGIVGHLNKRLGSNKGFVFPDIADFTPPDPENALARKLVENAKGRIIVGIIGMEPYKGSYEFMRLAKNADPDKYFFAFCGTFDKNYYNKFHTPAKAEEFREFILNMPENCIWAPGKLAEGAEYNAVFNAMDILFLYYHNFTGSSNRLTKSAHFQKLVIASDKNCVGEYVRDYKLGVTVTDCTDSGFLDALDRVTNRIASNELPFSYWSAYIEKNSEATLKLRWEEILSLLHA